MKHNAEEVAAPAVERAERLLRLVSDPPEGMHWTCPRCEGRYYGTPPANGICAGCHRPAAKPIERASYLAAAGVPARYLGAFVEPGPDGKQAAWPVGGGRSCLAWLAGEAGWSLLLHGPKGTGKSAIAAELLWRSMQRLGRGGWVSAERIANLTLGGKSQEAMALIDLHGPLVIDEVIGDESPAAWGTVVGAICRRWEQMRPTIITTNLEPLALVAKSEPMADRLRDGMVCKVDGKSLRGQR